VLAAFQEYYQTAELLDVSDPNLLRELYDKLRDAGIRGETASQASTLSRRAFGSLSLDSWPAWGDEMCCRLPCFSIIACDRGRLGASSLLGSREVVKWTPLRTPMAHRRCALKRDRLRIPRRRRKAHQR
jgi:hypothetical protein